MKWILCLEIASPMEIKKKDLNFDTEVDKVPIPQVGDRIQIGLELFMVRQKVYRLNNNTKVFTDICVLADNY